MRMKKLSIEANHWRMDMNQEHIDRYMRTVQNMEARGEITWNEMLALIAKLADRMKAEGF
jgi:hypothetical protein